MAQLPAYAEAQPYQIDGLLYRLGRHVFQAAWHEDQRLASAVATHLASLPRFSDTIELLYLALGGDLCELRSNLGDLAVCFAPDGVYPQPALHRFMEILPGLSGAELAGIPRLAAELYGNLTHAFGRFLQCPVPWGLLEYQVPVWKVLYANFGRLSALEKIGKDQNLVSEASRLEREATIVTDRLLSPG